MMIDDGVRIAVHDALLVFDQQGAQKSPTQTPRVEQPDSHYPQPVEDWRGVWTGLGAKSRSAGIEVGLAVAKRLPLPLSSDLSPSSNSLNLAGKVTRLHLHLLSDSTGETLEMLAKSALSQFEDVETIRHFWPMVRSEGHLTRTMADIAANPGLVLFTFASSAMRDRLETHCAALGLPVVAVLDPVLAALSSILGQEAAAKPGKQHSLDAAYFARVEAIQFTIAHDDGVGSDNWEAADIVLAGVSRSSKTPTSIYLANKGYKTANIPVVVESPPPQSLYSLKNPLVVGLVTSPDRLVQIRRNRLLSLNQTPDTDYVDQDAVIRETAFAKRMFADNGWPVIDMTRRSIEEAAAAIINLHKERKGTTV
jgi:[pyruvate, water dikinase]-phosphate phosphotransferase / [pyruvate, water dikinase] kinase